MRLYTGDDFNFPSLIASGSVPCSACSTRSPPASPPSRHSTATTAIATTRCSLHPAARPAVRGAHVHYKTGIVFLAWLNGHQHHFRMVAGAESARTLVHLAELVRLADAAGLLRDPGSRCRANGRSAGLAGVRPVSIDPGRLSFNEITADHLALEEVVEAEPRHRLDRALAAQAPAGRGGHHQELRTQRFERCRGASFRHPTLQPVANARPTTAPRWTRPPSWARRYWCWCARRRRRDLAAARRQVLEGIEALTPYSVERGVRLGIEPLHPMMIAERSVVVTLAQALQLAERFDPAHVGVVIDAYHVWWDPRLEFLIERARGAHRRTTCPTGSPPPRTCSPAGA